MALDLYRISAGRRLRCGFTTGTCAALAAQAATCLLLDGRAPATAAVVTPAGVRVESEVLDARSGEGWARCAIRKDGGDDVDATDGALIYAQVEVAREAGVAIQGGAGVGRVTKPGLDQPVGEAAINSVPRKMIAEAVYDVCRERGCEGGISVTISVPEGERIAARTFNPKLGIEGGISILGTSGIVEPRSLAALRESIELEIRQHAALGCRGLVIVPGNYGLDYLAAHLDVGKAPVVACSNFMGAALDMATASGFERILVVGHIGKMIKVAGGIMDTHSRVADCRAEVMCAHAAMAGVGGKVAREIMGAATTDAMLDIVERAGVLDEVLDSLAGALETHLHDRVARAVPADTPVECDVAAIVFSQVRGALCSAGCVDGICTALRGEYGKR
ncbi:cobalt-precorrin-5B (C(1))-methyltransferase CbiD [Collinsella tanakaei]|uniref:cobalt-precorrin-5B (C(1))-methyltransferase CbiD n=1 Tax=Collinsella tanakaei TaxID=626935 RepID=UPI0025A3E6B8|nr:cobalt-precorrin-5B (C(1))-methyltransferase CbiD [Collinsella tanakaei]MDM8245742.1 cobalt-precorrin-5B (C(1))-methyltransferase CbiD [Collinsella tanakaei]